MEGGWATGGPEGGGMLGLGLDPGSRSAYLAMTSIGWVLLLPLLLLLLPLLLLLLSLLLLLLPLLLLPLPHLLLLLPHLLLLPLLLPLAYQP